MAGLSISANGGVTYSRIERLTSTYDSFTLISKTGQDYGGELNIDFGKSIEFYANAHVENFDFDPPGNRTLEDSKVSVSESAAGFRFLFGFGDLFLSYAQTQLIVIEDITATSHRLGTPDASFVNFGMHFTGKGKGFKVGGRWEGSLGLASDDYNGLEITTNFRSEGRLYLLFWGGIVKLYAGAKITDYDLGTQKYFHGDYFVGASLSIPFGRSGGGSDYDYNSFSIPRYPL